MRGERLWAHHESNGPNCAVDLRYADKITITHADFPDGTRSRLPDGWGIPGSRARAPQRLERRDTDGRGCAAAVSQERVAVNTRDIHLRRLPWPRHEVLALGDQDVELRVTLSYSSSRSFQRRLRHAEALVDNLIFGRERNQNPDRVRGRAAGPQRGWRRLRETGVDASERPLVEPISLRRSGSRYCGMQRRPERPDLVASRKSPDLPDQAGGATA